MNGKISKGLKIGYSKATKKAQKHDQAENYFLPSSHDFKKSII